MNIIEYNRMKSDEIYDYEKELLKGYYVFHKAVSVVLTITAVIVFFSMPYLKTETLLFKVIFGALVLTVADLALSLYSKKYMDSKCRFSANRKLKDRIQKEIILNGKEGILLDIPYDKDEYSRYETELYKEVVSILNFVNSKKVANISLKDALLFANIIYTAKKRLKLAKKYTISERQYLQLKKLTGQEDRNTRHYDFKLEDYCQTGTHINYYEYSLRLNLLADPE